MGFAESVVFTAYQCIPPTLKMAQQIAEVCDSEYMQVTYDLTIARIAFGIQCQEAPKFDNVFIHLGGLLIIMSYFKAIGSFIEDCGIRYQYYSGQ